MDNDIETVFDLESLRNWNRSQLKLLKIFVRNDLVTQKMLAGATGMTPKSNALAFFRVIKNKIKTFSFYAS